GVDERGKDSFSRWEWSRAVLLVVLIEMAFFGTGNVASLNSFNPSFVRCFVQIFSPFLMTSLLLLKILLPFLSVAFAFVAMLRHRSLPISRLTNVMLVITDAMALVFFMQLTDEGSWLQIGTSISHYVICMAISVFVFALLHLSHLLLSFSVEAFLRGECRHAV
ncbi:GPI ethanolamine phosphate transferase 1, partial [Toxocara canis]